MVSEPTRWITLAIVAFLLALPASAAASRSDGDYYLAHHPAAAGAPDREGVVVTLHGGGWKGDLGAAADQVMAPYISDLRTWGFPVYNLAYQSGGESLPDTIDAVRRVQRRNPDSPVCVLGGSAGAHLALMAAVKLPRIVECVIDLGGPPNLEQPDTRPLSSAVPDLAAAAFGAARLHALSPINRVDEILAPVLVVAPDCDWFTSLRRQQRFAKALRHGRLVVEQAEPAPQPPKNPLEELLASLTPPSGVETGHCRVTNASFDAFRRTELRFLEKQIG